jgi:hypothetical protein
VTLVTVGIPTFNRVAGLRRAAESVLAQTHREIDLVISDDGSSDGTEALCAELQAADPRVRCLRKPVNGGLSANFNTLYGELRGDHVMMLSDDDWLEPTYIERCLAALTADAARSVVCGRARYLRDGVTVRLGAGPALDSPDAGERVLEYLRNLDENGLLYGIMRRETLLAAAPMRNVLGNDLLLVAAVVVQGPALTLDSTSVNRTLGGTSADIPKLLATLGLPRAQARLPHVVMAWEMLVEVLWRGEAFRRALGPRRRALLALRAAATLLDWRSDAWHATAPTAARIGRRRRGAAVWRAYLALTKRLGATHEQLPDGRR